MIKMSNHNITQHGTHETGLGDVFGGCAPDSQHGISDRHPANVGCYFFRYTNDGFRNHNNHKPKHKTWTTEDNQLALRCYFRRNRSQIKFRNRMIEIWQEYASFQTTSQRLADQVRKIIKKAWFSDLDILEIDQKINNQRGNSTVTDISRAVK